ncbi:MAG: CDP-glucose 4,6-dehydratase [Eubacteriales bacterium]|nr:CDP-glucose 4,6-dehydratase [Eubacteriales bacterium]
MKYEMKEFYKDKKILVTGHTGFKGSYLCQILCNMGAEVIGYGLKPPTTPALFDILDLEKRMTSVIGDIRDFEKLQNVFEKYQPEIVFHLAAQPIVRESYVNPMYTYETNVMGTVHICECVRKSNCVKSFLNVTTDKVYENQETGTPFTEDMPLDGYDPYSNSKSCSELVTHSYIHSFFDDMELAVSTARAGNVIGGGDFAKDRIVPDCYRAASQGKKIVIRNPYSVRPYQHVLEPLYVYMMIAMKQYEDKAWQGFYNVGPDDVNCITTGEVADCFCDSWGENLAWENQYDGGPHEAGCLKLNCDKVKKQFGWCPKWNATEAIQMSVTWYQAYHDGADMIAITNKQIGEMFDV